MIAEKYNTTNSRQHAEIAIAYFKDKNLTVQYSLDNEYWYDWTDDTCSPPFLPEWNYRIKELK